MLRGEVTVGRTEWLKETQKKKMLPKYGLAAVIQVQTTKRQEHH